MARGWSVLAGLTVPALAVAALALPAGRQLVAQEVARTSTWFDDAPTPQTDLGLPASGGTGRGWGVTVWPPQQAAGPRSVLPTPPPPPVPPARPWERTPPSTWEQPPVPAVDLAPALGPVLRLTRTVAPGEAVVLPRGPGQPHLLCPGPTTPGAVYWLDSTGPSGTRVHRYDGSGVYDFSYRYVTRPYQQTGPCT